MASVPLPRSTLTRAELDALPKRLLNRGGPRNPDVHLLEWQGRALVLKDFAPKAAWVRRTVGRWITRREGRAWSRLTGHPAVPDFEGFVDELALLVEYRPGQRMSRKLAATAPPGFLDELESAVAEMHARGVVHLDLRHRTNVMVGEDGRPVLIDFGSAWAFRPGGLAARWLLPWLARIDRGAVRKWRSKLTPAASEASGV